MSAIIEHFIAAARVHGAESLVDHEIGDLQAYLRFVWAMLTPTQQQFFLRSVQVRGVLAGAIGEESSVVVADDILNRTRRAPTYPDGAKLTVIGLGLPNPYDDETAYEATLDLEILPEQVDLISDLTVHLSPDDYQTVTGLLDLLSGICDNTTEVFN